MANGCNVKTTSYIVRIVNYAQNVTKIKSFIINEGLVVFEMEGVYYAGYM